MCVQRTETDDSPARMVVAFHGDELDLSIRDRAVFELVHLITGQRLPFGIVPERTLDEDYISGYGLGTIGELIEIRPCFRSASSSPTIW